MKRILEIGPAAMVAAAFIGPGTVTTATLSGAGFGYTLLWAVVFSVLTTILLQEMAARLGLVSKMGLGQAIRVKSVNKLVKILATILILSSILIGNAAYEAGNISGAVLGFPNYSVHVGSWEFNAMVPVIGIIAFILLFKGKYRTIERFLIFMVALMSFIFLLTAILVKPDIGAILTGMFIPRIPENSLIMVVGLIGTTVVPYNLFLHASTVRERWKDMEDLKKARLDTVISVLVGGLITLAIITCSAAVLYGSGNQVTGASELALQVAPVLGSWSGTFIAFGFLAAGLSSAITAPLAAAYASVGILGWEQELRSFRFRYIWIIVLLAGLIFAVSGYRPISIILFAQVANGIMLPIVVIFLLWVMNDKKLLKQQTNSFLANFFGILVILIALILGLRSIFSVFNIL